MFVLVHPFLCYFWQISVMFCSSCFGGICAFLANPGGSRSFLVGLVHVWLLFSSGLTVSSYASSFGPFLIVLKTVLIASGHVLFKLFLTVFNRFCFYVVFRFFLLDHVRCFFWLLFDYSR